MTVQNFGVIRMETTFQEASRAYRKAAAAAHYVIRGQFDWIANAAEDIGVPILKDFTPVDTGKLRDSTEGFVWADANQVRVSFEQPAQNRYGVEYAPFLILGTRYMPPRPYNVDAAEEMEEPMNEVIWLAGRRIASELTAFLTLGAVA